VQRYFNYPKSETERNLRDPSVATKIRRSRIVSAQSRAESRVMHLARCATSPARRQVDVYAGHSPSSSRRLRHSAKGTRPMPSTKSLVSVCHPRRTCRGVNVDTMTRVCCASKRPRHVRRMASEQARRGRALMPAGQTREGRQRGSERGYVRTYIRTYADR